MSRITKGARSSLAVSFGIALAFLVLVVPRPATAQCRSDRDCPSNRVCIDASCLFRLDGAPSTAVSSRPYRPSRPTYAPVFRAPRSTSTAPTATTRVRDPAWAFEAGVTGVVATVLALSLGLASEITNVGGQLVPALPLGAAATLVFGAGVPLVAAGGASAREKSGFRDTSFLRIMGWGTYGASLTLATILILIGVSTDIPSGIITATTLLGTSSLVIMTVDAFKARNEVLAAIAPHTSARASLVGGAGISLAPRIESGRVRGLMLGWGGRF